MKRRELEVRDYRAAHYFRQVFALLGETEIEARLSRLDLQIRSEKGLYLREWVLPRQSWWLGIKKAKEMPRRNDSFRRALEPQLEKPLQTAVKLSRFHTSMPDWKKQEFRARLLADDYPDDTLFELDTAGHYFALGYEVEWFESRSGEGKRSPEFIARAGPYEFEVECKAKQADSGRKIERAAFYRTADILVPLVQDKGLVGTIYLTVPKRLPTDDGWRSQIAEELGASCTAVRHLSQPEEANVSS